MKHTLPFAVSLALFVVVAPGTAQESQKPTPLVQAPKTERKPIYDEAADAEQLVGAALAVAKRDNKRVLLMYGGNWCGWCYKLDEVFKAEPAVRRVMRDEYELVHVDIGRGDKHVELSARFGSDHRAHGYPYLTIVGADGQTVTHKDTAELEDGPKHDPAKVLEFLEAHIAVPVDACERIAAAQQEARESGRLMFVHIGAPWCGWCHKLEGWMAKPNVEPLLARVFVDVKIDQDRMTHGKTVAALIRQGRKGGIPWFAFTDADLAPLATSDGPEGNCGFPAKDHEIEHFVGMLRKTERFEAEELSALEESLRRSTPH
ncbi:MAG: thioredoxin family protein [Planctomycetota bacterium]